MSNKISDLAKQKDYKDLTPFDLVLIQKFPFIEEDFDAINLYGILSKIKDYLNNVIANEQIVTENQQNVYNSFVDLHNYVNDYFTNLDVQEEINNKLDEMVENGTFDTILSQYSIGKTTFRSKLYLSKIGRLNITDYINNGYYGMQAGCYVGNNQYIYSLIKNNSTGDARIFKLDFATGTIISYKDLQNIYHANGCCLKDNHLFITQTFDENHNDKYGIVEIDVETLDIVNIHNINFNNLSINETILAVGYDSKYNKFYLIARNYFYVCDNEFNVESVVQMKFPISKNLIRQGGTFYDDYVCIVVNNENAIICFNRDGTVHHIIEIGEHQVNNFFGEIENVNVYNNELYINSNLIHNSSKNLSLIQFFKANVDGGGLPQTIANNTSFQNNVVLNVIVNKTKYNTLNSFDKFTCNGTSAKPFENLAEALCYVDNIYSYNIEIGDTNEYSENLAIYNQHLQIKANSSKFGSTKIVNSKVSLSNFYINHSAYRTPSFGTHPDYNIPLYITLNSEVYMIGNCGYVYDSCVEDGMNYPCIVEGSIFIDGSRVHDNYNKFTLPLNEKYPLILQSVIQTNRSNDLFNDVTHFSLHKDDTEKNTNTKLLDLTPLEQYSNKYRGLWVAININDLNTDYQKFDENNPTRRIVIDDFDNNVRYGLKCTYSPNTHQFRVTPYKFNFTTNEWERDTTSEWYCYYMFEI